VAYIFQAGDPGYVGGQTHGLIAATADQSTGSAWSNISNKAAGGTGTALGTGDLNTKNIVNQDGCTGGAAYLCAHLVEGGYSDWYLPSEDELNKLYLNRTAIGGFVGAYYWSSSEYDAERAWSMPFDLGAQTVNPKDWTHRVRAIRDF
jgi:hypothetical protein